MEVVIVASHRKRSGTTTAAQAIAEKLRQGGRSVSLLRGTAAKDAASTDFAVIDASDIANIDVSALSSQNAHLVLMVPVTPESFQALPEAALHVEALRRAVNVTVCGVALTRISDSAGKDLAQSFQREFPHDSLCAPIADVTAVGELRSAYGELASAVVARFPQPRPVVSAKPAVAPNPTSAPPPVAIRPMVKSGLSSLSELPPAPNGLSSSHRTAFPERAQNSAIVKQTVVVDARALASIAAPTAAASHVFESARLAEPPPITAATSPPAPSALEPPTPAMVAPDMPTAAPLWKKALQLGAALALFVLGLLLMISD